MLHKVMRHGFEFWEAARNTGPVFEFIASDEERKIQAERRRLRRMHLESLGKIIALITFGEDSQQEGTERNGGGKLLNAKTAKTARGRYGRRKENPNDRAVWGDLTQFSDEEPVEILDAMGIPHDEETLDRRGRCEPDMAEIQDRTRAAFEVTQQEFFEPNNRTHVKLARLVSMALCRAHTNRTLGEIGKAHERDHASVCRAVKRVAKLRATNADVAGKIARIESEMIGEYAKAA